MKIITPLTLLLSLIFGGCYDTSLMYSGLSTQSHIMEQPVFCGSSQRRSRFHESKILFVIDKTSSNKKSDPNGEVRTQGIQNFIRSNRDHHLSYGVIYFSNKVRSLINAGEKGEIPIFTSDTTLVHQAIQKLHSIKDTGQENYPDILLAINKILNHDMKTSRALLVDYHILYVSDGSYSNSQIEGEAQFIQGIDDLNQKDNIQVHSVYYGNYENRRKTVFQKMKKGSSFLVKNYLLFQIGLFDSSSLYGNNKDSEESEEEKKTDDVVLLQGIANKGAGDYIDFNKKSQIQLSSELGLPWELERLVVYNLNSNICLNGYIGIDSDADGLCDKDEEKLEGFSPTNRFSFHDGYGDYFHYLSLGQQKVLPQCLDQTDEDNDLLTRCEENYLNSLFDSSEEGIIPLSNNNPDSDGDTIIDGIEALVYLSRNPRAPLESNNLEFSSSSEKTPDLDKILKHVSPFVPSNPYHLAYDTTVKPVQEEGLSCYRIQQSVLPLYPTKRVNKDDTLSNLHHEAGENVIFIYSLQKRGQSSKMIYQHAIKKMQKDESILPTTFNINQFQVQTFSAAYQK